jgi:hypothetical protein
MALVEGKTGVAKDGTRVIVRGGKIVPLTDGAGAGPAAGGGPKPRTDWGPGAMELPDGSIVRYGSRGGTTVLKKAGRGEDNSAPPELREFEINAAARATLMDEGERGYKSALAAGYNPGAMRNVLARSIEGNGIGNFAADVIRDNPSEKARAAELQFVDGALRTTSGANAPDPEVIRANKQYFRQPGENAAVEPSRQGLRQRFRDQSVRAAGAAYIDPDKAGNTLDKPLDLSRGESREAIPRGAYYRDPQGNIRKNENGDRGNPIVRTASPGGSANATPSAKTAAKPSLSDIFGS